MWGVRENGGGRVCLPHWYWVQQGSIRSKNDLLVLIPCCPDFVTFFLSKIQPPKPELVQTCISQTCFRCENDPRRQHPILTPSLTPLVKQVGEMKTNKLRLHLISRIRIPMRPNFHHVHSSCILCLLLG